ncbi:MAG: hypothetical protein MH252_01660 [Thermosynechococcaceae cyanobacterium MS004]|nr:hypothetical protein [Thermosynechococcaceae cyanobacterium MS004]
MTWRGSTTIPERIFSSLPYLLPLIDAIAYSGSFFRVFPQLQIFLAPLVPVMVLYAQIPFAGLVVFFALFFLVVRNEKVPHIIRFNTMQALLVDILLVIVSLILPLLGQSGLGIVVTALSSTVFLGVLAIFIYSVVQSLRGVYAEIPTLSDAVYSQVQ